MATKGFSVDNQNRNDVVAFWHAVYQASEGYQNRIKWNGNYNGDSGKISAEFVDDVERRLLVRQIALRSREGFRSDHARVDGGFSFP